MDLNTQLDQLAEETNALRNDISALKGLVSIQNNAIIKLLQEQTSMLIKYSQNEAERKANRGSIYNTVITLFPISTQENLDKVEELINDVNRKEIIELARALLHPGGFKKNLPKLLSTELILQYNVDGSHNKGKIRDYPKLMDVLFRATMKDGWSYKYFLEDLRIGFKCAKSRTFRNNWKQRQKQKEPLLAPPMKIEEVLIPFYGDSEYQTLDNKP